MYRFVLSGGPHAGKTTLLKALKRKYPEAYFVPEPATEVITRELAKQQINREYEPRVPWVDYSLFAPLVLDEADRLEKSVPSAIKIVFQDRSLIDTIAYLELNNIDDYRNKTWELVKSRNYTAVFFCEPIGNHTVTQVRRENSSEAQAIHDSLFKAYQDSEIPMIDLPTVSVNQRIEIISGILESL